MSHQLFPPVKRAGAKIDGFQIFGLDKEQLHLLFVTIGGKRGTILHFENPPVHQIGTQALGFYAAALDRIERYRDELSFLIFSFAPDAVHAGGDLKETLANLARGEGYDWAEQRLLKALGLYKRVRILSNRMRTIGILAGGAYYGGSAEIALWADQLVGDSRASICMSEACVGLIPGWAGVARLIEKAGVLNARCLVETARKTNAHDLKAIGALDVLVDIPYPLTKDMTEDARRHACSTLTSLFAKAFALALKRDGSGDRVSNPPLLMSEDAMEAEIARRSDPHVYREIWGKPIADARDVLEKYKAPLAPQSVTSLHPLVAMHVILDEACFVRLETELDMELYRHPLLAEGIRAALEKRVPCFTLRKEKRT